jgi:hypothetical protein
MWSQRILILGAAAVGAAAMTVAGPIAAPAHAAPCAPGQYIGCEPVPPADAGAPAPVCDLEAAFRNDPICGTAEVSGGM